MVQKSLLTYEQLNTVLCQIEAILNSRPLIPLSNDANDFSYLTPGNFLLGTALNANPENDTTLTSLNRLKFWKLCTNMQQSFWKIWYKHYLNVLQTRPKWQVVQPNIKVGSLVMYVYCLSIMMIKVGLIKRLISHNTQCCVLCQFV